MKFFNRFSEFLLRILPLAVIFVAVYCTMAVLPQNSAENVTQVAGKNSPFLPESTESGERKGSSLAAVPAFFSPSLTVSRANDPVMPRIFRECDAGILKVETLLVSLRFHSGGCNKLSLFPFQYFLQLSLPPRASPVAV